MQFKIGDNVVHSIYGVGLITHIEERKFYEDKAGSLYYQGSFGAHSKISVWIATETQESNRLRLVTAKDELDQYREILQRRPTFPPESQPLPHTELTDRLQDGSFQVICEIVRDLTMLSWQKPLVPRNAATLKQVRESLVQEWAIAAEVSIADATQEIEQLLHREPEQDDNENHQP